MSRAFLYRLLVDITILEWYSKTGKKTKKFGEITNKAALSRNVSLQFCSSARSLIAALSLVCGV